MCGIKRQYLLWFSRKTFPHIPQLASMPYIYRALNLPGTDRFFKASLYSDGLRYGLAATFAKYGFCLDASKKFLWSYLIRKYVF